MEQNQNCLHILEAEIVNFKNISHKEIELDGRSIILAGPNQVGKSSLIQAICSPVNAKYIPVEPIKQGEEKGSVELVIGGTLHGEKVKYKIGYYFSQANKRGRLVLHDKNGTQIKGGEKSILQDIIGNISFDIMEFVRLGRTESGTVSTAGVKKQIEVLKELMPQSELKTLYDLDQEKERIYNERTEFNREIKYIESAITQEGMKVEEIEKYSEPVDASSISLEIQQANEFNDKIKRGKAFVEQSKIDIPELDKEIEDVKAKLAKLEAQKVKLNEDVDKTNLFLEGKEPKDVSALNEKLNNIGFHNSMVEKVKSLKSQNEKLIDLRKKADTITDRLSKIEKEKKDVFANSKMPVKGLAFDENVVTYKGLPLSEDQLPTSQLIGIGLKIGMALNPNLRLLVIRDGSLLDNKTMNFVLEMCEKHNYQLLIEMVKHDGGELSIEFIEK